MSATNAIPVHPSNAEALQAWDGDDGAYWTENETFFDEGLARYREPFLRAADIAPDDRVLDIGCGTGSTTRDAARLAIRGSVLGVDLSWRILDRARSRAAADGLDNVAFVQADAQIHPFPEMSFDVAISRTGAMFFGDPVAAFANVVRALRPDGRLVLLVWQSLDRNHWIRDFLAALAAGRTLPAPPPDAPGPFSLADPDRTRDVLAAAGFSDVLVTGVEDLMSFGDTPERAYGFVRGLGVTEFLLRDVDAAARTRALAALRANIDAHATADGVLYPSAAWIVRARRAADGDVPAGGTVMER